MVGKRFQTKLFTVSNYECENYELAEQFVIRNFENMGVERKCPKCSTWNQDEDNCRNCGELLSPELIEIKREEVREEIRKSTPLPPLDIFLEKWKNSRFWLLRVLYKVLRTIAVIFLGIASFFAYLAASPNG